MENEETKIGIGNKETTALKPAKVKILKVESSDFGKTQKGKKIVCLCQHPEAPDGIKISSVKYETKGKLEVTGLWINKDSDGLIKKNSALAIFLVRNNCMTAENLVGKEVDTIVDEKGYLCFKGY